MQTLSLPFDRQEILEIEIHGLKHIQLTNEFERCSECHGCANNWPVTRKEPIGRSGMFHLMHRGPNPARDGACWCQRPDLHPENVGV